MRSIDVWRVDRDGDRLFIREKSGGQAPAPVPERRERLSSTIVIVGAGAAGVFCADMLRKEGHRGSIVLISSDESLPYDRPNLSKDYLAGNAPEEWIPLQPRDWYDANQIALRLGVNVTGIAPSSGTISLSTGDSIGYDALVLATGSTPRRLNIPGADEPHVYYLRTFEDSKRLIARAAASSRTVVIGASFIGLEVAASMRSRGLDVVVVGPEQRPLERVLGREFGDFIRRLHESKGVRFRLGRTPKSIETNAVVLDDGERLDADFVVIGVGVVPSVELAANAGLTADNGVIVNEYLETSVPHVFAAGDVARWPYGESDERIRIEH